MNISPRLSHVKTRHQLSLLAALLVWLGIFPACTTPNDAPPIPASAWGDRYAYAYSPPQKGNMPPGSVPVTVAVVNPSYRETDSAIPLSRNAG